MTQAIQSTSAVQIVHATAANIYTAAKDSVRKECEVFGNAHDNPELLDASRCLECLKGAKNKSCPIYKEGCSCETQDSIKCLQQSAE